jgi:hypothetical protein
MSFVTNFLGDFLQRPASSIPKGALWAVTFETQLGLKNMIYPAIKLAYEREPSIAGKWNTEEAANAILTPEYQSTNGCLFCQGLSFAGESSRVSPEGIVGNGLIRSYVGEGRDAFPIMKMSFLETNVSFVESFLRGWALATANFGLVARSKNGPEPDKNYRTDVFCFRFTTVSPLETFGITQVVTFKDVCCVSVSPEEYNYTPATGPRLRDAEFIYNSYSIDTSSYLPAKFKENKNPVETL